MKLILREYIGSLKEREELDAILPDLLSELGYHVFSRPGRGTTQHGVDVAAIGEHNGERKVFLFTVKRGDIGRDDWNSGPQALRQSLDDIQDAYIPTRIPPEHKDLKIVICICFGGDVKEQVRTALTNYTNQRATDRLSFEEWNGDKLAGYLLNGVLREEVLPKAQRADFQKAVALVDEPDVAYRHFAALLEKLRTATTRHEKVRSARQVYLCLWILYVWARDIGNLEAPYRASELALLSVWELLKNEIGAGDAEIDALAAVFVQLVNLNAGIANQFLGGKIYPHTKTPHALSVAVGTRSAEDVNLKLFDILGRIAVHGLWHVWARNRSSGEDRAKHEKEALTAFEKGLELIHANQALYLPVADYQATNVALFLVLWVTSGGERQGVADWLTEMVQRLNFAVRVRGRYPTSSRDYRDVVDQQCGRSDEAFQERLAGSTLIPLLACWLKAMGEEEASADLAKLVEEKLPHCTMQLWLFDESSETHLYTNSDVHGRALADLDVTDGAELLDIVREACRDKSAFAQMSANRAEDWPLLLTACRHWQLPVPPDFWINLISDGGENGGEAGDDAEPGEAAA